MGLERRESQAARTVVAIGLTGGIGAGKSTALALFEECGALVCSADQVVHQLYERPEVVAMVARHFGPRVLGPSGMVDRVRLAAAVRGNAEELHWLEGITHPLVAQDIARVVSGAPPGSVVVCEVPLLFETGFQRLFDLVVTVEAGSEARQRRSTHNFGPEQFAELEALQASGERRVEGSDLAFENDGSVEQLREFVQGAYDTACEMLTGPDEERV